MLAEHPAKLRRDSVATLDPFTFDPKLDSTGRRTSDSAGLDSIVIFFEEFGVVAKVTEATFDQYWLRQSLKMSDAMDEEMEDFVARKASVSSVREVEVLVLVRVICGFYAPTRKTSGTTDGKFMTKIAIV
ncbi:hypothetical protein J4E86_004800 [Alternaria arbusti]|uniref:uncharacterized protein n=1 Tax=Alternaria arbusti TaxID=232088 RepID=UPI00221EB3F6|nr:uncharacterized protein J4E86_004800 [Alternaria arbusti]KAI4957661.1 hypothetical protein J4E86_004800 [Alternaria arbusti]